MRYVKIKACSGEGTVDTMSITIQLYGQGHCGWKTVAELRRESNNELGEASSVTGIPAITNMVKPRDVMFLEMWITWIMRTLMLM